MSAKPYGRLGFATVSTFEAFPELQIWYSDATARSYWCRAVSGTATVVEKGLRRPVSNRDFWNCKLDGNVARDVDNQAKLTDLGWSVFLIWECLLNEGTEDLLTHLMRIPEQRRGATKQLNVASMEEADR